MDINLPGIDGWRLPGGCATASTTRPWCFYSRRRTRTFHDQRVVRRQEEEVHQQIGGDRAGQRRPHAASDRGGHYGDQVQQRDAGQRQVLPQQ
jgi:hypothetical protein